MTVSTLLQRSARFAGLPITVAIRDDGWYIEAGGRICVTPSFGEAKATYVAWRQELLELQQMLEGSD